jgi:hypothetical protein
MAGCFPSLGPYYREGQPFFDPTLLGKWESDEEDETLEVTRPADKNAYRISAYKDDELQYVLAGNLFRVEDVTFLDVAIDRHAWKADGADDPACGRLLFGELTTPIHQLYRVERTEDEVKIFLGDTSWIEDYLADQPSKLRHLRLNDYLWFSNLLLTDTPDALQAFFSKYSEEAFDSDPSVYTRIQPAPDQNSAP